MTQECDKKLLSRLDFVKRLVINNEIDKEDKEYLYDSLEYYVSGELGDVDKQAVKYVIWGWMLSTLMESKTKNKNEN